nr:hypothetical protein [Tanacetum cinerariifolium]
YNGLLYKEGPYNETFKATERELLLDTHIRYLQVISDLKKCGYLKDNCELNFKFLNNLQPEWKQYATMMRQNKNLMDINIDALYNILKQRQRDVNDAMGLKKKTVVVTFDPLALIAEKMKKEKDEQVLLAGDHAWMESNSDSDQEINANMVFMDQTEKVLSDSEASSSSADDKILGVSYYLSESEREFEYETSEYHDNTTTYDTLRSIRRPKPSGVMWMRKGPSNTIKANLSSVNHFNLNKNVKRYCRKNLMACNKSDTRSAFDCNNARNSLCNARMNASVDMNDLFVFDDIVQICLWIIDSGCLNYMTGNRALLMYFVEKFLGTVRFGNTDFVVIAGYKDVVIESIKSTCFVRTEDGVDLITGDRSSNLYTIALNKVVSNSSTCLLAKDSSSQSWLWHQCLSHLNFATINNLVKNNIVQGLPKMKFKKDHLCFACEQRKIHRKHHKSKTAFTSNQPLYFLYMDLSGPMRIESINKKRYVLVVVDDYSRYTWVFFLHSKDEAFEVIISFIKKTFFKYFIGNFSKHDLVIE